MKNNLYNPPFQVNLIESHPLKHTGSQFFKTMIELIKGLKIINRFRMNNNSSISWDKIDHSNHQNSIPSKKPVKGSWISLKKSHNPHLFTSISRIYRKENNESWNWMNNDNKLRIRKQLSTKRRIKFPKKNLQINNKINWNQPNLNKKGNPASGKGLCLLSIKTNQNKPNLKKL